MIKVKPTIFKLNANYTYSLNAFTRMGLSASKPITMIQNAHLGRQGFTMQMPVFRLPEPSKDLGLRYEELIGWIAFPISIDRMVKPWLNQEPGIQARISMVENTAEPTLFFDNVDPINITLNERQGIRRALSQQSAPMLMLGIGTAENPLETRIGIDSGS